MNFIQCLIANNRIETWECQRWYNNRGTVRVIVAGKVRFRMDDERRVTKKAMIEDGYKLTYTLDLERMGVVS